MSISKIKNKIKIKNIVVKIGLFVVLLLINIGNLSAQSTLKIAATASSGVILEFIKPKLASHGIDLTILIFNDYLLPNKQLADKKIDANFVQHLPYLQQFNSEHEANLIVVGNVLIAPFAAYSTKFKTIAELPNEAKVVIPNDQINGARALLLLQQAGLITLNMANSHAQISNITSNSKNLNFIEVDLSKKFIPSLLRANDLVLMNLHYALAMDLNPQDDAVIVEQNESPYVNVVATHPDNKDLPELQILINELHSDATREFILQHFKGNVIPVF